MAVARNRYQTALLDEMNPDPASFDNVGSGDTVASRPTDYQGPRGYPEPIAPTAPNTGPTAPITNTGVSGLGQPNAYVPGTDARAWIQGLLGGGPTNERTLAALAPQIDAAFGPGSVQMASDNTARGRLLNIPGYGMVTLIGDQQTWGGGPWAWRTGNEQFGSGGGGGGAAAPAYTPTSLSLPTTGLTDNGTSSTSLVPTDPRVSPAFVDALLKLMNPTQASLSDPDLAAQAQANRIAQQRSYERRRASGAERAAQSGVAGGGVDAMVDTLLASRGDAEAAYEADLLAGKNTQNREAQLAALGPVLGLLGLGQSESQFTRNLGQNESQFSRDIALRQALSEAGLNQQAIMALLGGL